LSRCGVSRMFKKPFHSQEEKRDDRCNKKEGGFLDTERRGGCGRENSSPSAWPPWEKQRVRNKWYWFRRRRKKKRRGGVGGEVKMESRRQ